MSKYKGKRVLVVGLGRSGVAVTKYMVKQGAKVIVTDIKQRTELTEYVDQIVPLKVEMELGKHNNVTFQNVDLVVVSPGVPLNIKPLDDARAKGIPITTEIEIAARGLKAPLIGITGTNGKTTTTTLVHEFFMADGKPAFLGGNIGNPLLNYLLDENQTGVAVAELSSFQLDLIEQLVPAVAVFTNIDQNHLDRYPDMNAYIESKKRLLKVCDRNSFAVFNYDDEIVKSFARDCAGKVVWFMKGDPMKVGGEFAEQFMGCYLREESNALIGKFTGSEEVYDLKKLRIFGDHNKENLMAAVCVARVMGVSQTAIQKVIDDFKGVPHRLEFVRKKDSVFFFNDSKATNVMSVYKSLSAFKKAPIILIAGGKDKGMDFSPLADLVRRRVKLLVLMGEAKEKINRSIGDYTETYMVGTFEEAVLFAYQKSRNGDIILLSPGCASFDMFRNYEERGDYFKKLISQI